MRDIRVRSDGKERIRRREQNRNISLLRREIERERERGEKWRKLVGNNQKDRDDEELDG